MNSPHKIIRRLTACLLLACGGFAAAAPDRFFPRPEDPVVLPTDAEVAEQVRTIRESWLRILKWDADGWDDLWVMIQMSHDRNYQFNPNDRQKDTDGDGMSDYEEMLVHRSATYKEPVYTKEQQIARIREERRQAIINANHVAEKERMRRDELAPLIISPLATSDGRPASAAEVDAEKLPKLAALAWKHSAEAAAADRRAAAFAQRHGIARDAVGPDGTVQSLIDVVDGVPQFNITHNAVAADSISTDEVRPGGSLGLNLTGGGTAIAFTAVANNGAGKLRLTVASSTGFTVGQSATISGATVATYNGTWPVLAKATGTIDVDRAFTATATGNVSAPVSVAVWDGGDVFSTHQEFTTGGQRVTDKDGVSPLGIHFHPTHVTGTIIGKGVDSSARGMAYNAALHAYDWRDDRSEMPTAAGTDGIRISNHSYGPASGWGTTFINGANRLAWFGDTTVSATEDYRYGFYDVVTRQIDEITYDAPNYLPVWSAGNERGSTGPVAQPVAHYANEGDSLWVLFPATPGTTRDLDGGATGFDTIAREGVAKNVLTVAAVEDLTGGWISSAGVTMSSFGSFGSCDDGRIKPDISANGVLLNSAWNTGTANYNSISGTSMAAPSIAGSAALLVEHYTNLFGTSAPLRAATLKALLIHTADEAGTFIGPDYRFGWGLMNTKSAAALLTAQQASGTALRHVSQTVLQNGDFIQCAVRAIGGQPLRVTIVWTDPAGVVPPKAVDADLDTTRALVNDLDLRLISGASTLYPWKLHPANPGNAATRTGDNKRDNVEQVLVDAPVTGQMFLVRVTHKSTLKNAAGATAPQMVSMIVSGNGPALDPEFRIYDISPTGINKHTITWSSVVGAIYRLQSSTQLTTWADIAGDFVATKEFTAAEVTNATGEGRRFWRVKRLP